MTNTRMTPFEISFDELCAQYAKPQPGTKDGSYLVRGLVSGTRSDANLKAAELVILDADSTLDPMTKEITSGAPDPMLVHEVLKNADIQHFIYTSYSNNQRCDKNHPGGKQGHRFRVLIPAATPILDKTQLAWCVDALIDLLHEKGVNLANAIENKTWSQLWFEPRVAPGFGVDFKTFRHDGLTAHGN